MKVAIINDLAATARFEPNPANFDGFVRSKNARLIDGNGSDLLLGRLQNELHFRTGYCPDCGIRVQPRAVADQLPGDPG